MIISRYYHITAMYLIMFFSILAYPDSGLSSSETYEYYDCYPPFEERWFFNNPTDIAIDSHNHIYILNAGVKTIKKFARDGQLILQLNYDFKSPIGMTCDHLNHLYVIDSKTMLIFYPNGKLYREVNLQNVSTPVDIAINKNRKKYILDMGGNCVVVLSSANTFLDKWDSYDLDWPSGIAVDSENNVYIADTDNQEIRKFNEDGKEIKISISYQTKSTFIHPVSIDVDINNNIYFLDHIAQNSNLLTQCVYILKKTGEAYLIEQFGNYGPNDGEFSNPRGISVDSDSNIYVSDAGSNKIQKFDNNGNLLGRWGAGNTPGEFNEPAGIAFDSNNNLYVADSNNNQIVKLDSKTNQWEIFINNIENPRDIAIYNKTLYAINNPSAQQIDSIKTYDLHGVQAECKLDEPLFSAYAIAVDEQYIFITDGDDQCIKAFNHQGSIIKKCCNFSKPRGIDLDEENLYIADEKEVFKISKEQFFDESCHNFQSFITEDNFNPWYVDVDKNDILIVDSKNHCIQLYNKKTAALESQIGGEPGNLPGMLNEPWGCARGHDEKIYITDNLNHRVQVFQKKSIPEGLNAYIIPGGGPDNNTLWDNTMMCSNWAKRALENIGYSVTTFSYPDDLSEISLESIKKNIYYHSKESDIFILYMVDHGGTEIFCLDNNNFVSLKEVDSWLDEIQSNVKNTIVLIYDACRSNSFIQTKLQDRKRILITSSANEAYFVSQGTISFSYYFWTNIFNQYDLKESFEKAKESMLSFDQEAQLWHHQEINIDNFRPGYSKWSNNLNFSVTIETDPVKVEIINHELANVRAIIIPVKLDQINLPLTVLEYPSVPLTQNEENNFQFQSDAHPGVHQIVIQVTDNWGNSKISPPIEIKAQNSLNNKALILVGESAFHSAEFENDGQIAYSALKFQAYTDISFFSPTPSDYAMQPDIDTIKTTLMQYAASGANEIILFLVGRGKGKHIIFDNSTKLSMTLLDEWLDEIQNNHSVKIILVIDIPFSNANLIDLIPVNQQDRILISSTTMSEQNTRPICTKGTFSNQFWKSILCGKDLWTAFCASLTDCHNTDISPELHADKNAVPNESSDQKIAENTVIGSGNKVHIGILLSGDIVGTIVHNQTNLPVADCCVSTNTGHTAYSLPDGRYKIIHEPANNIEVFICHEPETTTSIPALIDNGIYTRNFRVNNDPPIPDKSFQIQHEEKTDDDIEFTNCFIQLLWRL